MRRYILIIAVAALFMQACAKQGMPSGGPKDTEPPRQLGSTPGSRTLNFNGDGFYIGFDEYVVLKDAENNIIVSPPMANKPEYRTKGKGIQVRFRDSLLENTTYLFQFKDAVADFNEGNLLPSLEYVFSTGNNIDSMTIGGSTLDALTLKAREEAVSMWLFTPEQHAALILSRSDTSVKAPKPTYVTRCDKNGNFRFNYIRPGAYHIVAVQDEDKNMQIGNAESVAFLDSLVEATTMPVTTADSTDTTRHSITIDNELKMMLFAPQSDKQRVTGSDFIAAGKVRLTTMLPMEDPAIDCMGEEVRWIVNTRRDTVTLWTMREQCDSLKLIVRDATGLHDTLNMRWRPKKPARGLSQSLATLPADKTGMKFTTTNLPFYDTLTLVFSTPMDSSRCIFDSAARIMSLKDSSVAYCDAAIDIDGMHIRLLQTFSPGERYEIDIPKGIFHDIYGNANDSLHAAMVVSKVEDYGNLTLTVENETDSPLVVELLDGADKVVRRCSIAESSVVPFLHLKPAKYSIRLIVDSNGNGKWDTGDFGILRQPERVVYFPKSLDIRSNWDFNEKMSVSK